MTSIQEDYFVKEFQSKGYDVWPVSKMFKIFHIINQRIAHERVILK